MDRREIRRRIDSFPRWHYQFDLGGELTPISESGHINRHRQRRRYFFDPLVRLCGGSLRGKRVLDLGCNAGFWSLCAAEAGCDFVLGIDGCRTHVAQAALVFHVKGIDRSCYRFVWADVFDTRAWDTKPFDVVLCLGLLYHLSCPINLLAAITMVNTDLLVIDTALSAAADESFRLVPDNAVETGFVLWPTAPAVVRMASGMGYRGIVLRPDFDDYAGAEDFRDGARRAFVCAKRTDLSGLASVAEATWVPDESEAL